MDLCWQQVEDSCWKLAPRSAGRFQREKPDCSWILCWSARVERWRSGRWWSLTVQRSGCAIRGNTQAYRPVLVPSHLFLEKRITPLACLLSVQNCSVLETVGAPSLRPTSKAGSAKALKSCRTTATLFRIALVSLQRDNNNPTVRDKSVTIVNVAALCVP